MGKAGFAHLQGAGKRVQIYVKKDVVGEKGFRLFHLLDLGDSIGVRGHLFRTKTNELSIWVDEIFFLAKALRSEEHTSELQSRRDLVCRLLLEKKKKNKI